MATYLWCIFPFISEIYRFWITCKRIYRAWQLPKPTNTQFRHLETIFSDCFSFGSPGKPFSFVTLRIWRLLEEVIRVIFRKNIFFIKFIALYQVVSRDHDARIVFFLNPVGVTTKYRGRYRRHRWEMSKEFTWRHAGIRESSVETS